MFSSGFHWIYVCMYTLRFKYLTIMMIFIFWHFINHRYKTAKTTTSFKVFFSFDLMFLLVFLGGWCCSASLCGFVVRINIHRIQKKNKKLWSYNNISNFNIWCWSSQPPAPSFLEINPLSMKTFLEMKLKSSWDTILEISFPFFNILEILLQVLIIIEAEKFFTPKPMCWVFLRVLFFFCLI